MLDQQKEKNIQSVEHFKELFYRCNFSDLLDTIDQSISHENDIKKLHKLIQLKVKSHLLNLLILSTLDLICYFSYI